ncbi:MAG: type II toxin-antitoxin system VapC family toxin [Ornithinimicrobium sp.]|uniref:type II toxin-antitoxin system VapC family toxin n=1 Tax=Ornithinimicrobium sp. TaxID=1977084 RepID=UPI00180E4E67|nr:type II toxin-antitoxin system VapC family toxin [Actinomycetota bacterium]
MILDTSAVVAILQAEPEADRFAQLLESADRVHISVATVLEASLVVGPPRQRLLDDFLTIAGAVTVPVDDDQLALARTAHLRFGRGSGSSARLNFGDCFAYALAQVTGEELLFKGDDFGHTDVRSADG